MRMISYTTSKTKNTLLQTREDFHCIVVVIYFWFENFLWNDLGTFWTFFAGLTFVWNHFRERIKISILRRKRRSFNFWIWTKWVTNGAVPCLIQDNYGTVTWVILDMTDRSRQMQDMQLDFGFWLLNRFYDVILFVHKSFLTVSAK